MKTILELLEEAKTARYDWADAAIRNYNPNYSIIKETKTLSAALIKAFSWRKSPEYCHYWNRVCESLTTPSTVTSVTPTSLESLIEDLGKLNSAIENLEYNGTLKEPYRSQVYDATKASYKEQLAEVKVKIAEAISLKGDSAEELSMLKRDLDRQMSYSKALELKNDGLSKELEAAKGKMLIGWVTSDINGYFWRWDNSLRKADGYWERKVGERLTPDQAMALCGRLPKWSDDEPTPIYE